jgi:hypothetical protein
VELGTGLEVELKEELKGSPQFSSACPSRNCPFTRPLYGSRGKAQQEREKETGMNEIVEQFLLEAVIVLVEIAITRVLTWLWPGTTQELA